MNMVCPHCGQPMVTRYGVSMSPVRLRILDTIRARPGLRSEQLASIIYPGVELKRARRALFTNIVHLNSALAATEMRVVRLDKGYRVMKGIAENE